MDLILQLSILVVGIVANVIVYIRASKMVNPISIVTATFFLPLVFALMRLSGLQANKWADETYILLFFALAFWLWFPTFLIGLYPKRQWDSTFLALSEIKKLFDTTRAATLIRVFALMVCSFYLAGNYLQSGLILPVKDPLLSYSLHVEMPFGLRLISRSTPAAACLLFTLYYVRRNPMDLLLVFICLVTPLSRLSRIDVFQTTMALFVLNTYLSVFKFSLRNILSAAFVGLSFAYALVELGTQRLNRFGMYSIKYEDVIVWKGWRDDFQIFPTLYAYFPLSFENLDRFVTQYKGPYLYGIASLDWLFTGFLKLNWFSNIFDMASNIGYFFTPVSTGANVPTALPSFYMDFGVYGAWIPMMAYCFLWVLLFARSYVNGLYVVMFSIFSGAFALSSFQAIMASPAVFQQMFYVAIIFYFMKRSKEISHGSEPHSPGAKY